MSELERVSLRDYVFEVYNYMVDLYSTEEMKSLEIMERDTEMIRMYWESGVHPWTLAGLLQMGAGLIRL